MIFSIRISSKISGDNFFHQDFITLMLVLGLGQLLTTMLRPTLVLTESFQVMQVLPMATRGEKSEIYSI